MDRVRKPRESLPISDQETQVRKMQTMHFESPKHGNKSSRPSFNLAGGDGSDPNVPHDSEGSAAQKSAG